jgi:hypothetical protein
MPLTPCFTESSPEGVHLASEELGSELKPQPGRQGGTRTELPMRRPDKNQRWCRRIHKSISIGGSLIGGLKTDSNRRRKR